GEPGAAPPRSPQPGADAPHSPEVAVVALAAHFASVPSLEVLRRQLLGEPPPNPAPSANWWGLPESQRFPGHYLEQVTVAAERFRIPPREIEEMLPQQALMLQVAADALRQARLDHGAWPRAGFSTGRGLDPTPPSFPSPWSVLKTAPALPDAAGPPLSANRTMGALASIAASRIAREFRFGGPGFTVSDGGTSGLRALRI